jgi:hypothetical protein
MQPLALRIQHSCLEPFLDLPPQRSVLSPLGPHPDPPGLNAGVEEAVEVRFDHPVLSLPLALERPFVHCVQGSNVGPLPLATAPEILLVEACEDARDRPRQQLVLHGWSPSASQLAVSVRNIVRSDQLGPGALPLQALDQVAAGLVHVLLGCLRAHRHDAVGGIVAVSA